MLLSADLMVDDPDAVAARLIDRIGVAGRPGWRQDIAGQGYVAHFLRTHKSLAIAPTRIEVIGLKDDPDHADPLTHRYMQSLDAFQGSSRPTKTHSTVLVTDQFESVAQRLFERGIPFRVPPPNDQMPSDRLWLGSTPEHPEYDPSVDGGLAIEIMALAPLAMPAETFTEPVPEPAEPESGSLVRIVGRSYLVRDLDAVIGRLAETLDWFADPIEEFPVEGFRRARLRFALPHSATLDLIQPLRWDCPSGRFLAIWGAGPYFIRVSVHDLAARADAFDQAAIAYRRDDESASAGGSLLQVQPGELSGAMFEFVEHRPTQ